MANPRKPTRAELSTFLPDDRSIRAFEKIFDFIPTDFDELFLFAQVALDNANQLKSDIDSIEKKLFEIELLINDWKYLKAENKRLLQRIENIEKLEGIRS